MVFPVPENVGDYLAYTLALCAAHIFTGDVRSQGSANVLGAYAHPIGNVRVADGVSRAERTQASGRHIAILCVDFCHLGTHNAVVFSTVRIVEVFQG